MMSDEDERSCGGVVGQFGERLDQLLASTQVQRCARFVEYHDAGFVHQRARQQDALAFS